MAPGTRIGPYEILAPIGAGGMGEVYRARDTRLDRLVAVKFLSEGLAGNPAALARFERKAKAVAALSHPNIMAIHDFGKEGEVAYAVMELLEGQTLREALAGGPLPASQAADVAAQVARGLAATHERGIVHRDLKPANVFLTKGGHLAAAAGAGIIVILAALLRLDTGGLWSKWFGSKSSPASIRSIAVLPLANVSGNPEQEYFSDDMTDDLITHLSKISALKVISRTSVMQFKDTRKPLKDIAHELNVEGIIEGSVLRSGDKVRITAQLIDASTAPKRMRRWPSSPTCPSP